MVAVCDLDRGTTTMAELDGQDEATALITRLQDATNARDLEGIVACFAADYRNETPAHPERGFVGREQVRKNWQHILAAIPDLSTEVVRQSRDGDTVWTEWEHRGTRLDGSKHLMRGVVIFGVADGVAAWARFYLEPVLEAPGGVDEFLRKQVGGAS
jgi:ketosteroid isomerase-like protein